MADMTHAQMTRMIWIDARLVGAGKLNRSDIRAAFGISDPQANTDIRNYDRMHPGRLSYDTRAKTYHPRPGSSPAFKASLRLTVMAAVSAVSERLLMTNEAAHSLTREAVAALHEGEAPDA